MAVQPGLCCVGSGRKPECWFSHVAARFMKFVLLVSYVPFFGGGGGIKGGGCFGN